MFGRKRKRYLQPQPVQPVVAYSQGKHGTWYWVLLDPGNANLVLAVGTRRHASKFQAVLEYRRAIRADV